MKIWRTKEGTGEENQEMDRLGLWQVSCSSEEQGQLLKVCCKVICGVPMVDALILSSLVIRINYHSVIFGFPWITITVWCEENGKYCA